MSDSSTETVRPVVLLVDDNPNNLQVLFQALDGQGYQLLIAKTGEDALRIADQMKPEVILLDVMMPGIDGYETCRRLKADEATCDSAVLFLTALKDTREKVKGLSLGAVDFITKPFDVEEVLARVECHIRLVRQHAELVRANKQLTQSAELTGDRVEPDRENWLKSLIEAGEGDRVEFKSTVRQNLKSGKPDKAIEFAWLKTVVAFLNSEGGVLLVGVADDGTVLGLGDDGFQNDDRCLLHVNNRIQQHIGLEHVRNIRFALESIDQRQALVVECWPTTAPVFLRDGKDESFFIRVGPGSRKLSTSEVLSYVSQRQRQE